MRRALVVWSIAVLLSACEDGPEQIFTPSDGDGAKESGYEPSAPWFQDGEKTFDFNAGQGDSVDRARFCDEREMTETINTMVSQPIVPDVGLGGLNMWSSDGTLTHANELIGRPEDGKFCDPEVYSNALTWGPTYEIIAFINEETKLMEALQIGQGYLGKLEGHYTAQNGTQVAVSLEMRNRVRIGGVELDTYASSANQASSPNSWVNHARINEMYRMLRETFFSDRTTDDCFATQVCEVFYASPNESNPQQTDVYFADSGVYLVFSPEGHLSYVVLEPVRLAKFETSVTLQLLDAAGKVAPKLTSASKPGCNIDLTGKAWQDFQTACVSADDTRTLTRATYDVHSARDAVDVNFNGVTLSYLRRTSKTTLLKDGERPGNTDKLFGMSFYRDLNAPVAEFVPANLGALYKARIEARLKALVGESSGHPFASYVVDLGSADLSSSPAPIGAITWTLDGNEYNLVDVVAAGVLGAYGALTPEQKRAAEGVLHPVFLIEPFVDSVLSAFT
ncbi:MAG: hypothetical protein HY901_10670, partial [Deltaproteobacteria bacterium]|nr:hypothetical protein [Deltaproteobacteria bacterium]